MVLFRVMFRLLINRKGLLLIFGVGGISVFIVLVLVFILSRLKYVLVIIKLILYLLKRIFNGRLYVSLSFLVFVVIKIKILIFFCVMKFFW